MLHLKDGVYVTFNSSKVVRFHLGFIHSLINTLILRYPMYLNYRFLLSVHFDKYCR